MNRFEDSHIDPREHAHRQPGDSRDAQDSPRLSFEEIQAAIKGAPQTWLPQLLNDVVETCVRKECFREGAIVRVVGATVARTEAQIEIDKEQANVVTDRSIDVAQESGVPVAG